jgi:dTDP-4-amino-4,6-dideoxygalactose transaminase
MSDSPIPFNRPLFLEEGLSNLRKAFQNAHVSGDGSFTRKCQDYLESNLRCGKALLTTSGTDALEVCSLLLNLNPGDEIIVPAFTFVSSANAFVLRGAIPIFVDIRPDTLNLDESMLEVAISPRTKAIVVVHYAGISCEMDRIIAVASQYGLAIIEDNAHGIFGSYRGQPLGSIGNMAALSFHETKNLHCGEGGAVLINDRQHFQRSEIIREKGTDRSKFFRGEIDKYSWVDVGSSFLLSDALAAILWAQMSIADTIQLKRKQIFEGYRCGLTDWAGLSNVGLPYIPSHCGPSYHMFYLLMPDKTHQEGMIRHLKGSGVNAVFHYQALNRTPMGIKLGGQHQRCPVAEDVAERIVRLPFFFDLTSDEQDRVISAVVGYRFDVA